MTAIFYDLETSDTAPIGQILNYCFIEVDNNYKILSECSGEVDISVTQLPRVGALLANRIDPLEHKAAGHPSEPEALKRIQEYIAKVISNSRGRVPLIGYNSAKFDLPFLRTSMMRFGLNPYFGGQILARDLFLMVKFIAATSSDFPRPVKEHDGKERLTLSMEALCHAFKLLDGKQTHESRDDVLLTIKLAEHLHKNFDLDIRSFNAYQVAYRHQNAKQGDVLYRIKPNYEPKTEDLALFEPMTLLDAERNSALWIDLERYREGQGEKSIRWFSVTSHFFAEAKGKEIQEEHQELAKKALDEFKNIKLNNFFTPSTCDIELDIYRLHNRMDFKPLEALYQAIWEDDPALLKRIKERSARILYRRYELIAYDWSEAEELNTSTRMAELLKKYALFRYSGDLQLSRVAPDPEKAAQNPEYYYHPSYSALIKELDIAKKDASEEDLKIIKSLGQFYLDSPLIKAAGAELE